MAEASTLQNTSSRPATALSPCGEFPTGAMPAQKSPTASPSTPPEKPYCRACGATKTRCWRTGPAGPRTLCSICGSKKSSAERKRKQTGSRKLEPKGSSPKSQGVKAGRVAKRKPAPSRKDPASILCRKKLAPSQAGSQQQAAEGPLHAAEDVSDSFSSSSEDFAWSLLTNTHATRAMRLFAKDSAHAITDATAHFEGAGRASQARTTPPKGRHTNRQARPKAKSIHGHPEPNAPIKCEGPEVQPPASMEQQGLRQTASNGHVTADQGAQVSRQGSLASFQKPLVGRSVLERKPLAGKSHANALGTKGVSSTASVKRKRGQAEGVHTGGCEGSAGAKHVMTEGLHSPVNTHKGPARAPKGAAKRRKQQLAGATPEATPANSKQHANCAEANPGSSSTGITQGKAGVAAGDNMSTQSLLEQPPAATGQLLAAANGWTLLVDAADAQPVKRGRGRPPRQQSPALLQQYQQCRKPVFKREPDPMQPQQQLQDEPDKGQRPQRSVRSCTGRTFHAGQLGRSTSLGPASMSNASQRRQLLPRQAASSQQPPASKQVSTGKQKPSSSTASKQPLHASAVCLQNGSLKSGSGLAHSSPLQQQIVSRPRRSASLSVLHAAKQGDAEANDASQQASGRKGICTQPSGRKGSLGSAMNPNASASHAASASSGEEGRALKQRKVADRQQASGLPLPAKQPHPLNVKPPKPRKPKDKEGLKPWFGDQPLNFENYLIQTAAVAQGSQHARASHGPQGEDSQSRYQQCESWLENRLRLRAQCLRPQDPAFAEGVLNVHRTYLSLALEGSSAASKDAQAVAEAAHTAISAYVAMLKQLYNTEAAQLILDPFVLSADVLQESHTAGGEEFKMFRLLQKRFILYRQSPSPRAPPPVSSVTDVAKQDSSKPIASARSSRSTPAFTPAAGSVPSSVSLAAPIPACSPAPCMTAGPASTSPCPPSSTKLPAAATAPAATPAACTANTTALGSSSIPASNPVPTTASDCLRLAGSWSQQLNELWGTICKRMEMPYKGKKNYAGICPKSDNPNLNCSIQDCKWKDGLTSKVPLHGMASPLAAIQQSTLPEDSDAPDGLETATAAASQPARLYLTDCSMASYKQRDVHPSTPGLCCAVNDAANVMVPPALRSNRPQSLFHCMKVESSGTASYTFFAALGGPPKLTAFHQETKKRRSFNLGCGDFIIQPLATAENIRKMERVHAAATGGHRRHGQLLPLEAYLEEGIPLVLALRQGPPEMVELPEQSMHAFITWANITSPHPALKVSCNDWSISDEVTSAYLLEKLMSSHSTSALRLEHGFPPDGADQWVGSSYFTTEPWTQDAELASHLYVAQHLEHPEKQYVTSRPWADQMEAPGMKQEPSQPGQTLWWMEIVAVRTAELLADTAAGLLPQGPCSLCCRGLPDLRALPRPAALAALRDLLPTLLDLQNRAYPEATCWKEPLKQTIRDAWFTQEYLASLIGNVKVLLGSGTIAGVRENGLMQSEGMSNALGVTTQASAPAAAVDRLQGLHNGAATAVADPQAAMNSSAQMPSPANHRHAAVATAPGGQPCAAEGSPACARASTDDQQLPGPTGTLQLPAPVHHNHPAAAAACIHQTSSLRVQPAGLPSFKCQQAVPMMQQLQFLATRQWLQHVALELQLPVPFLLPISSQLK
ncbi:hypothetical protein WJX74_008932 [Apatococcus lobatus]|uniref:GATA-type domain-containing protein n=1 Tax=Apatococcus lobatus TaxID=904363 RepID=A0AAW1RDS3_9CHLO